MSFRAKALKPSFLTSLILGLLAVPTIAQVPNSPIVFAQSAITTSFVNAPTLGGSGGGSSSDSQWLKVEFHFAVTPPVGKFLDSAEFRVWIEGVDLFAPDAPTKDGIAVGLTGSVTYVCLPAGKDVYGVFFVPPDTIGRYSSEQGPTDFDRHFNVHVEAYVGGAKVDYFDKNKENDASWYERLKPMPAWFTGRTRLRLSSPIRIVIRPSSSRRSSRSRRPLFSLSHFAAAPSPPWHPPIKS